MKILPDIGQAGQIHEVAFWWGAWIAMHASSFGAAGAVFTTGKAVDEDGPVTMNVQSDRPVYFLYGVGDAGGEPSPVDLRRLWTRVAGV